MTQAYSASGDTLAQAFESLDEISEAMTRRGGALYGGEAVTQLAHALQCATLAEDCGSSPALITAALLHDLGHMAGEADDEKSAHSDLAARLLGRLFGIDVTEPVRLHVDAKRYLCAVEPGYADTLSAASRQSLVWQGGAYSAQQATAFAARRHAHDAVCLRRWDDAAKTPGRATRSLEHFMIIAQQVQLANAPAGRAADGAAGAGDAERPDIEIRLATDADLAHLVRLMVEMDDLKADAQDADAAQKMRVTLQTMARYPDFKTWLVLEGGRPVASYSLMIFCSPSHNGTQQALLDAVVVQRDRRSAGLGNRMLRHAMRQATAAGCYKLMLSSNIKRADAHRFYENLGFTRHGISFGIDLPPATAASVLQ